MNQGTRYCGGGREIKHIGSRLTGSNHGPGTPDSGHGSALVIRADDAKADSQIQADSTIVLNTYGIWRFHCTIGPLVLTSGETVKLKYAWLNYKTSGPPRDWMNPGFNDRFWNRGPVTLAAKSAMVESPAETLSDRSESGGWTVIRRNWMT